MKKLLSILLIAALILSLGVTAFAQDAVHTPKNPEDSSGQITLTNATIGETYELYKLFDAALGVDPSSDGVVYKLPAGKSLAAPATNWFEVNAAGEVTAKADTAAAPICGVTAHTHGASCYDNGDPATGTLTCALPEHSHGIDCYPLALTASVFQSTAFQNWAKSFGTKVTFGTTTQINATETTLVFKDLELGYYMLVSSLNQNPNANPVNLVTINTTMPSATVIDKNQGPEWDNGGGNPGKIIVDDQLHCTKLDPSSSDYDANHTHTAAGGVCYQTQINEANLNEDIHFNIGVSATNYNGDKKIWKYVITDALPSGMSYVNDASHPFVVSVNGQTIQPYDQNNNPNGYTITWYTADPFGTPAGTEVTPFNAATAQFFRIELPWTNLTQITGAAGDPTKELDCDHLYAASTEIHVDYHAILDPAKAASVDYEDANVNKANFTWYEDDDQPDQDGNDPDHQKPEKQTKTFISELKLYKVDGNGQALTGAEFTLTGVSTTVIYTEGTRFTKYVEGSTAGSDAQGRPLSDYTYWLLKDGTYTTVDPATTGIDASLYATPTSDKYIKESFTEVQGATSTPTSISALVDASGNLVFHGLAEGTYTIEETKVPEGYNKAPNVTFTVSFDYNETTGTVTPVWTTDNNQVAWDSTGNQFKLTVENKSGSELPETGGFGTVLFYLIGASLFIGAAVVLVTRRRITDL